MQFSVCDIELGTCCLLQLCTNNSVRIFTATYPLGKCLVTLEGDMTLSAKVSLVALKHSVIINCCSNFPRIAHYKRVYFVMCRS